MQPTEFIDACGVKLQIGDRCVALAESKEDFTSGFLIPCFVVGFTPQMVNLVSDRGNNMRRKSKKLAKVFEQLVTT